MKAVVLAGGRERGFAPLSRQYPKALLPVANMPLLAHTLRYLSRQGVRETFVCIDAGSESIREKIHDWRPSDMTLQFILEPIPMGTAGCLRELRSSLGADPFLVVAGMPFIDFPLDKLMNVHRRREATITVALVEQPFPNGFAEEVILGRDGDIEEIIVPYGLGNGGGRRTLGVYILDPRIFRFMERESYLDLKEQLIPRIRRAGLSVIGAQVPGVGVRLDTIMDYLHFSHEFLSNGYMGWRAGERLERLVRLGEGVSASTSADLRGPLLIGNNATVGAGAWIEGPTAIGPACRIQPTGTVIASILMGEVEVSERARLQRCVVASGCHVPPDGYFEDTLLLRPEKAGEAPLTVPLQALPGATSAPLAALVTAGANNGPAQSRVLFRAMKRALDLCGAILGLALAAPVLAIAALAVALDSAGPVFFRQRRVGLAGCEFSMVKLRTMVPNAERLQEGLADRNEVDGPMFKIGKDPRITRIGRFLRATRIDEIPQLFNVLQGHMSLVGPRPLAMQEMRYNPAWRDIRLSVKPGATGLWQVDSTRKNSFQDWIAADIRYVEQQSLRLDLHILGRTVREIWRSLWSPEK